MYANIRNIFRDIIVLLVLYIITRLRTYIKNYSFENLCTLFREFRGFVSGQFAKVLSAKTFIEYEGVIINGRVIILDNGESGGIMDVAFLSHIRQYLPNSSFPNVEVDVGK